MEYYVPLNIPVRASGRNELGYTSPPNNTPLIILRERLISSNRFKINYYTIINHVMCHVITYYTFTGVLLDNL